MVLIFLWKEGVLVLLGIRALTFLLCDSGGGLDRVSDKNQTLHHSLLPDVLLYRDTLGPRMPFSVSYGLSLVFHHAADLP